MHTPVLFEHPLNEKMRTWLRIEFLIQQMAFHPMIASHADALHFFRNAGDLLDVLERGEVRTDLLKELERQQRKLSPGQKCRASIRSVLTRCASS
jgi:cell division protein ZapD